MLNIRFLSVLFCLFSFSACAQSPAVIENKGVGAEKTGGVTSSNPFKVVVKKGDTIYSISKANGVAIRDVIDLNKLRPPYVLSENQVVRLPNATFHIVKSGDTVFAISRSYGVDMGRIVHLNKLTEPYVITAGSKILLPSKTTDSDSESSVAFSESTESQNIKYAEVSAQELTPIAKSEKSQPTQAKNEKTAGDDTVSLGYATPDKKPTEKHEDVAFTKAAEPDISDVAFEKAKPEITVEAPKEIDAVSKTEHANLAKEIEAEQARMKAKPEVPTSKAEPEKIIAPAPIAEATPEENKAEAPKVEKPASNKVAFAWPIKGKVISRFGPKNGGLYNDGINISAKEGSEIKASDSGQVVYSGNELRGYGNLVLLKHDNGYVTAYAHANKIDVKKGERVEKGQVIAYVGTTGHVSKPQLYFSIRQGRKALDPEKYLGKV